jgi:hypothetical protein
MEFDQELDVSNPASSTCDDGRPEIPAELIEAVCDLIATSDLEQRTSLHDDLRDAASSYLDDKFCPLEPACPKEQRAAIRKLRRSIERVLTDLMDVAPEFQVALGCMNGPNFQEVVETAREAIIQLHRSISTFDAHYRPVKGAPADVPLENVVRDLFWLIEEVTGEVPRPKMNKHGDGRPTLESAGARAIGMLLTGIDPTLNDTKIANMLEKLRRRRTRSIDSLGVLLELQMLAEYNALAPVVRPGD